MALAWYGSMLGKYPLPTKMITSGTLMFLGDGMCQKFEGKEFSLKRSVTFGAVGMLYIGPMLHMNYSHVLPYLVPEVAGASASLLAVKKLMFDQFGFAPLCTIGFFMVINTLEGNGP